MIWVKSLAGGIVGILAYAALIAIFLWLRTPSEGVGASALPVWIVLTGAILSFLAVSYWTFRKNS
jgi:hypothetical protein